MKGIMTMLGQNEIEKKKKKMSKKKRRQVVRGGMKWIQEGGREAHNEGEGDGGDRLYPLSLC